METSMTIAEWTRRRAAGEIDVSRVKAVTFRGQAVKAFSFGFPVSAILNRVDVVFSDGSRVQVPQESVITVEMA